MVGDGINDSPALAVARRNAKTLSLRNVSFRQGDWFAPLPQPDSAQWRFHMIVSNPPYIAAAEMADLAPEVRDWEPSTALFGPAGDPDLHARRILEAVPACLAPGGVVLVELGHDQAPRILDVKPGFYEGGLYGLAIDLGSTTIAAHLCDLQDGSVLASSGLMNPQIRFGEDLMSRVSYSMMNASGAEEMTLAVREGMCGLFTQLAAEAAIDKQLIVDAVFVCNPVMHHLFLGIDPLELGQAPFALATSNALRLRGRDLDLNIHESARVYILPCIAGHVGAEVGPVNKESSKVKTTDVRFARFNHEAVVVANSAIDAVPALRLGLLANVGSPPPTKVMDEPLSTTWVESRVSEPKVANAAIPVINLAVDAGPCGLFSLRA